MNSKIINFALEAGVLDPPEGVVEEDDVETFARYILEEALDVMRREETLDDACRAIKDHFDIYGVR